MPEPLTETPEVLERIAHAFNNWETVKMLGVEIDFIGVERVRARIDRLQSFHRGGLGSDAVNGGIIAALFDLVIGLPGYSRSPAHKSGTVQISMSLMRAVRGEKLVVEGWIERAAKGLVFVGAEAMDEKGTVCARANGVCRILKSDEA
jgi:acyl-coenzyme A thioesterase PaaI-like protein